MKTSHNTQTPAEKLLLLCAYHTVRHQPQSRSFESRAEEAAGLVHAAALDVTLRVVVNLTSINPSYYVGSGKCQEIKAEIDAHGISLVVVDAPLTPVQQRNLEREWKCKVIDRTGLILDIFRQRAQTREGRLQVELAELNYQKGRLVRAWSHLERQRGGGGFTGGPGEKQIELDRRSIRDRIKELEGEIDQVKRTRALHRKTRRATPYPIVSLVGYTNAGKSTLFNRLTGAQVVAEDKLFATLDPTLRVVKLPGGLPVILSDTVGFVSELPTLLVAAFRATLEEVLEAALVIHVRDIANPESDAQKQDVESVLKALHIRPEVEAEMIEAWNKIDLLPPEERDVLSADAARLPQVIPISAHSGDGLDVLLARIEDRLTQHYETVSLSLPHEDGKRRAWLHEHGTIVREEIGEQAISLEVRLSPEAYGRWQAQASS